MDDKLKAAIAAAYQRQSKLIEIQSAHVKAVEATFSDLRLCSYLCEAVYQYHKPEFDRLEVQIKTLEAMRDA